MGIIMGYTRAREDIKKGDLIAIEADEGRANDKGYRVGPWDWKNWSITDCDDRLFTSEPQVGMSTLRPNSPDHYGDLLTFEEYKDYMFSNDDGIGAYATELMHESTTRYPSEIDLTDAAEKRFTHIMWYNK